ncbi:DNA internalization-related competence protein ComEC/Rec2 [Xylophilus rhododendri]|uniref:DNA internalization-related competence protein ComEC/Rec2 n=1 Tax=Xylophilus rhododendri TaxID=2697032 RepID=A0A857JCP0_9BURK|nr:DNA internalization-related competence protein ComEC/Rec2 [Xylophilus rhododendri]QHJ01408.1 DNA internalization-related competence protein ComEC/Rec2 [Xylophilus rhododendri]
MQPRLWSMAAYLALAASALLGLRLARHPTNGHRLRAAAVALAAAFALCGLRAAAFQAQALSPALEGRDLLLTGTVAAMPQSTPNGMRFRLEIESASQEGAAVAVPPLIDMGWWTESGAGDVFDGPALRAGQRWQFTARLKAPHGSRNPHGFDYELWAWEQGVQATGSVRLSRSLAAPRLLQEAGWRHPVEAARQSVRDAILVRLARAEPGDAALTLSRQRAAGVVAALVTGDQQAIARSDWDLFRATGVAHLMSISGLHVTMFAWMAAAAIGWLWRRSARLCAWRPAPHAALLGGILLAGLYALFSGGGLPAQRTVLMLAIVAVLRLSGRRWPWPQVWLLACAAAVALDPWALLQAGFWLSFVAVGVLFASTAAPLPQAPEAPPSARHWRARLGALLREQAIVTVALAPLTLLLFSQLSLVGLPANLLAIPWTTLVVTPLSLLGVAWPPCWDLAAGAVRLLVLPLEAMAAWPHAVLALPSAPIWVTVLAVLGGALACMPVAPRLRLLGIAPLLPALLWFPVQPRPGRFELLAVDVGQGSAVLVRTAGHALLYDTGPRYGADDDAGQRLLVPLLQAAGVRLDTVVVSHRDDDHAGGAASVLASQPQAALLASIEAQHPLQSLRPATRCEAGQHWSWDGVDFSIVHPQAADYRPGTASNALSCVLRIQDADGHAALLTGDIAAADEARLLASGAELRADWLLVPHHGSRGSSSPTFIAAVAPRVAIAQAGYRNRFGHPAAEAMARYTGPGVAWTDTIHCGAARWSSERPEEVLCERREAPRYWQHNPA